MSIISPRSGFQIRPRFTLDVPQSVAELDRHFKNYFQTHDLPYTSSIRPGYLHYYPKPEDHHVWSPHLSLTAEDTDQGAHIRGHYGPSPVVWTAIMFVYAAIALLLVICSVIGMSHWSLGESTAILWAVPVLLVALSSVYLVSYFGQKQGHDDIIDMHHLLEDILDRHIE